MHTYQYMLHIKLITPEKILIDDDVDEVVIPTTTGELAILPHHIPLVTQVAPGIVVIKTHGREEPLAVDGGFITVTESSVTILADYATHARDVSAIQAELAKKDAEKAMKDKKNDVDFAMAEAEFRRAILELKLSKRKTTH